MQTNKISASVSIVSNSIGAPTGYGMQAELLAERMIKSGMNVASQSNYGLEGTLGSMKVAGKQIPHYPRGWEPYSQDVIAMWHKHFVDQHPGKPDAIFGLYDVWVWNQLKFDGKFIAWTPLDHLTLPPAVGAFLKRENVTPVAMSPHGQRQLAENGIDSIYIPHVIDSKVMKPTQKIAGRDAREFIGINESDFLVGMVAANKANGGFFHRKAFAENLLAFSIFAKNKPDVQLYLHTEPSAILGGFNLAGLLNAVGIAPEKVIFPDPMQLRAGYPVDYMAGFYTAMDVLLATSYGEGFGVPQLEAQACGTPVIASDFAASPDLVSQDSWLIPGQPFWDEKQASFFAIPSVPAITKALEDAYEKRAGHSNASREFALQFDADTIWRDKWQPFFASYFAQ